MTKLAFISHSLADVELAEMLDSSLRQQGYETWLDTRMIPVGERFVTEIAKALGQADIFILIGSRTASASYWVDRELQMASRLRSTGYLDIIARLDAETSSFVDSEFDLYHPISYGLDRFVSEMRVATTSARKKPAPPPPYAQLDGRFSDVLPPDPTTWLGFSEELAALDRWWSSDQDGAWVSGVGGSGKTSLASTWLRALELIGYRDAAAVRISGWNFYSNPYADALLNEMESWVTYGGSGEHRLLYLDGLEQVSAEETVRSIEMAISLRFRVLATSRNPLELSVPGDFMPLELQRMTNDTMRSIMAKIAPASAGDTGIGELMDLASGHPLLISVIAQLLESGTSVSEILQAIDGNDPSER